MDILVSINCITFNHEKYIADAIKSFLMQKTDFEYEILMGEDCSTDNTRKIIQEFQTCYPEKIKLITSDKNIGARDNMRRLHENSKGKYIAICEGDDYWTDEYKLQKQIDYMLENKGCTFCFHSAKILSANGVNENKFLGPLNTGEKKYTAGEILLLDFIPTASFLYTKHIMDNPPKWYYESVVGDLPLSLIVTNQGYAYYIDEVMSVYRRGVKGSITYNWEKEQSKDKLINVIKNYIYILDNFNEYSNYKYSDIVEKFNLIHEIEILILERKISEFKNPKYNTYLKNLGRYKRIKIYTRCLAPKFYNKIAFLKAELRQFINKIKFKLRAARSLEKL